MPLFRLAGDGRPEAAPLAFFLDFIKSRFGVLDPDRLCGELRDAVEATETLTFVILICPPEAGVADAAFFPWPSFAKNIWRMEPGSRY